MYKNSVRSSLFFLRAGEALEALKTRADNELCYKALLRKCFYVSGVFMLWAFSRVSVAHRFLNNFYFRAFSMRYEMRDDIFQLRV